MIWGGHFWSWRIPVRNLQEYRDRDLEDIYRTIWSGAGRGSDLEVRLHLNFVAENITILYIKIVFSRFKIEVQEEPV